MWVSSGAMLNRMNLGLDFAAGRFRGIRLTGGAAARGRRGEDGAPLEELAKRLLPGANTEILLATIRDELARSDTQTPREQASMALGLILGSPEFQRH